MLKYLFLFVASFFTYQNSAAQSPVSNNYTLIVEGFDWGPGANKVVLPQNQKVSSASLWDYTVSVTRSADGIEMQPFEAGGEMKVVHAYVSDEKGTNLKEGNHITLVLFVSPNDPLTSPIKYIFKNGRGSNKWINYQLTIQDKKSNQLWKKEKNRILPGVDKFDLSGKYSHADMIDLTYASYVPSMTKSKNPLIIWLHGGGEGGTDPSIPLIANKVVNYASERIQAIFGGAYVLVPQSPSFWMQNANGNYTTGEVDDVYNKALIGLIKKYVSENHRIDQNKIYVGGCSNGGYMSLKLILQHPDFFAAGFISALAYQNQHITDKEIQKIKNIPIWFVHSKDDPVTIPEETVVPLYKRLQSAGAENVHFSFYNHVIDITGVFGGKDYHYSGHWSWIYSHGNHADFDFDGSRVELDGMPVTIMEWLGVQSK